jgi:hypothetical protein
MNMKIVAWHGLSGCGEITGALIEVRPKGWTKGKPYLLPKEEEILIWPAQVVQVTSIRYT